ncbi:MAG TPA: hypothetical protein VFY13_01090 [Luteolibacter sp.]|nr:hypothetical protein [Luteolibacter sp.]
MKAPQGLMRALRIGLIAVFGMSGVSCMTTYDAYGRPVESVDPGLAIAGVVAAGIIGHSMADGHHYHGGYGGYCAPPPRHYGHCR